jgi:VIT1/CCC1 family predicted Fe2+/Mn2+ transporter
VPVERGRARRSALVVGAAALVGSLLPLAPFCLVSVRAGTLASAVVAALVLFGLGAYKARMTTGRPIRNGVVMAIIGLLSALAGYGAGWLFRVPGAT